MDLNFRGTKLSRFSRFDSHPRKFSTAKIKVHTVMSLTLVVHKQIPVSVVAMGTRCGDMICTHQLCLASSAL